LLSVLARLVACTLGGEDDESVLRAVCEGVLNMPGVVRHPRWQEYSPRRSDGSGAPGRGGGDNGVLAGPALWPSRHSGAQVATHLQHEREHLVSTPALLRPAGRCAGGCRARV
jgi:hypothetical protein